MLFEVEKAEAFLTAANTNFTGMLPTMEAGAGQQAVPRHAKNFVAAIEGLQQQLLTFGAPVPRNNKEALEQEVSALQQELSRADALLQETTVLVKRWQQTCHHLRDQHEAALTQGIGSHTVQDAAIQAEPAE